MQAEKMQVRMLGGFSIQNGQQVIRDSDDRSKKPWLLLAYMIYYRDREIPVEELADFLWGESEKSSNPLNALKTMFHRVRTVLDQLGENEGRRLIINQEGLYRWNPEVPVDCDVEKFDELCRAADVETDEDRHLELVLQALELYQGDFLPRLAVENWVLPTSAYFHNQYVEKLMQVLPVLESRNCFAEAVSLCRRGIETEPDSEPIYQYLMRNLLAMGEQREVLTVFEELSSRLSEKFGVLPSEESLAIYREAVRTTNHHAVTIKTAQQQLREPDGVRGALSCEFDFFKVIYHAEARAVARSGCAVHIGMISVTGENKAELSRRSLDRCMENLQILICDNLRKGDVVSQCSATQFILLLPMANFENSCMVCERITKAFSRKYPHSPAELHYEVRPIEPNL